MLIFFRKHYGHASWLITLPIKTGIYLRALLALLQMLYWNLRQSLGFVDKESAQPDYVFMGSDTMLDECRQLVRRKGLNATFAPSSSPLHSSSICIVYDTETYSFGQIIDMASKNSPARIGTYSPKTHILITPSEIIR